MHQHIEALREANMIDQAHIDEAMKVVRRHSAAIIKRTREVLSTPTNEFGQTIIDSDYGDDDLHRYEGCWAPSPAEQSDLDNRLNTQVMELVQPDQPNNLPTDTTTALIADISADMPAKPRKLREPDFYDNGEAFYIGALGVVSVPIHLMGDFEHHLSLNGMTPVGAHVFTMEQFTGRPSTDKWTFLNQTCKVPA